MEKTNHFHLKKTPLYHTHIKSCAKMTNFFGWFLPLEYEGILKEAKAARTSCALFDVSHMGEIRITGSRAFEFIQNVTTNDVSLLRPFQLQYNLFVNHQATIIDDFTLYRLKNSFLCVVNASNKDKVLDWLKDNILNAVQIVDESTQLALLSLQGPNASKFLKEVLGYSVDNLKYMHFIQAKIVGNVVLISRSGYTGERGYEIYCNSKFASTLWQLLTQKGKNFSLSLAGLGSRDVLRIEAGYPLYGNEIDETTNPLEASLGWAVKDESKDFIGKEKILQIKKIGLQKKRVGFAMEDKAFARKGYSIYCSKNNIVGKVTSGTYSPNLEKFIGMAYVDIDFVTPDTPISIEIRGRLYQARIEKFPFINLSVNF